MRIRNLAYALLLIFFSVFIFLSCNRQTEPKTALKEYSSLSDSTKYIGKEACRQCHSDKFETFMHTGMGMSFDTASKFNRISIVRKRYIVSQKGKDLLHRRFRAAYQFAHDKCEWLYSSGTGNFLHTIRKMGSATGI